jgi:DNA-binding CsgD family transcriptional regulator
MDPRKVPINEIAQRYSRLSPRQKQVADMTSEGLKTKEMARRLGISPRTVEIHRKEAFITLGASGVVSAAILVYRAQEYLK